MAADFTSELRAISGNYHGDQRSRVDNDIACLLGAGVHTYSDLLDILDVGDAKTQSIACWALGQLGKKKSVDALVEKFKVSSDTIVIWEAVKSLVNLGSRRAVEPLMAALSTHRDHRKRAAAAWALGCLRAEEALEMLLNALSDEREDVEIKENAAEALGVIGDKRAVNQLIMALKDSNPGVRFSASYALGQVADPRALPELERLAATDDAVIANMGAVKEEAAKAVQNIKSRSHYEKEE